MKFKTLYKILFLALISMSRISSANCEMEYPTIWSVENPFPRAQYIDCRVYHKSGNNWDVRQVSQFVQAKSQKNIEFNDHNDGLGMLLRDWSCAYSYNPKPFADKNSRGFSFKGCANQQMRLGTEPVQDNRISHTSQVKNEIQFCPDPQKIYKLGECSSKLCRWDAYGNKEWSGRIELLAPAQLASIKFVGVDADPDTQDVLGCVYEVDQHRKNLILLSTPSQQLSFQIAAPKTFSKTTGSLQQCLSANRFDCPLYKKF